MTIWALKHWKMQLLIHPSYIWSRGHEKFRLLALHHGEMQLQVHPLYILSMGMRM